MLNRGNGAPGNTNGGGSGPSFDVTLLDDSVLVTQAGASWTLSEDDLESIVEGQASLPQPLANAIGAQGTTPEQFAKKMLNLLD